MKKLALIFVLTFLTNAITNTAYSQVTERWVARYNGADSAFDFGNSIAVDASGNVYVTGSSQKNGNTDYVTIKYNPFGVQLWVKNYNGPGNSIDEANSIAVDASGNVYVTGRSYGINSYFDFATIKYNSSGTQQWVARYNGPDNFYDEAKSLVIDNLGNVYVTGSKLDTGFVYDYATIKYNSSGTQQWVAIYNGPDSFSDEANSLVIDNFGNVYVTGSSNGAGTYYDYATIKYNSSGIQQWVARFNGKQDKADDARSIAVDVSGNVYVTGHSEGIEGIVSGEDYATVKYNASGVEQWVAIYDGQANLRDFANSLALDNLGNVYVTGYSEWDLTQFDYATIKYNSSGVKQWAAIYDGPANADDKASSLALDNLGNVYVTGESIGTGTTHDYATVKYNASGVEQWVTRYNGTGNGNDEANSIALVDESGNVYVTGSSWGSALNRDIATIKYSQTPVLTGTLNIPGDYPDLADAIFDLNKNGVGAGGVTLNLLPGNPQTAPAGGYVIGSEGSSILTTSGSSSPITIQGNGNNITAFSPQSTGLLTDGIFKLIGADYVTITGFTLLENNANSITSPGSNNMTEWGIALLHVSTTDGCQNNTIQNNNISLKRIYRNSFGIYSNNRHSASSVTAANDVTNSTTGPNSFNKVYDNNISDVNYGTVFIGSGAPTANNAMDKGNDIGGNSASTGNTYTNWGGIGITPSGFLSLTTSNYCVFMNNQYNDNVSYNSITSAAGNVNAILTIGGILKDYSGGTTVQPSGTIFNTYNNNTVTIKNQTTGSYSTIRGIYTKGLNPALSASTITLNNNLITDCEATGSSNSFTVFYGIINESRCGILNISNNTVRGLNTNCPYGDITGIQNYADVTDSINIRNNKLGDPVAGFVTLGRESYDNIIGIYNRGTNLTSSAILTLTGNDIRGIDHSITGLSDHKYIYIYSFEGSTDISNNTFTNLHANTTGNISFIEESQNRRSNNTRHKVNNNSVVNGFTKSADSGYVYFYLGGISSSSTVTDSNSSNNFSNISLTGSTDLYGWSLVDVLSRKTVSNNVFRNITCGYGDIKSILNVNGGDITYNANNLSNNSLINITCNGGNLVGLFCTNSNLNIFNNKIDTLTGNTVTGIQIGGGNIYNVYGNKINFLKGTSVSGIKIEYSDTISTYNNLIGNILAIEDTAGSGECYGINVVPNHQTTMNLYYNTIYMSPISNDLLTSIGIRVQSSVTNLTMINNLVEVGNTGNGKVIAFRNPNIPNYNPSSNNNLFYAGTPSPNNLIFSDGGVNNIQTLDDYKTFISPRDSLSVTEDPNFISLNSASNKFLHIDSTIASQIESGGRIIAGMNNDYDLQPRFPNSGYPNNTSFPADNPDIGADEFGGTPPDHAGPIMSYSNLSDSCGYNNRNLNAVTINDPSGVAGDSNKPRVYWKVNTTGTWASAAAANASSPFSFTLGASGLTSGDSVFYFVIAQDNFNNVSASPGAGLSATSVNSISAYPTNPNCYVLNCWLSEVNFEWVREYSLNPLDNKGKCVAADKDGNSIVSGTVRGAGIDIVTLKYNPSGSLLWSKIYANPLYNGEDHVNDLITDESGNIYITGFAGNSISQEGNIVTIKYNPSGDTLWVKQYNGSGNGNDEGNSIALDGSGNVLVTGYSSVAGTNYDYITIKYDNNGNMLWDRRYIYATNNDIPNNITADDNGNIYVTGSADYTYLTLKYNSAGDLKWFKSHYATGGGSGAVAKMLDADKSGNVYVTGFSKGVSSADDFVTIKYDSSGNEVWLKRYNGPGNGSDFGVALKLSYVSSDDLQPDIIVTGTSQNDFLTLKYDAENGNILWEKRYNGPLTETVTSLALDAWGHVYITGHSFDYATNYDFVTVKYSAANGDQLWDRRYNSYGSTIDDPGDIALGNDGSVFVTGRHYGFTNIITTVKYKQPVPPPPATPPALNLTALIQGFYNSSTNSLVKDTLTVNIRSSNSPYAVIAVSKFLPDNNGAATFSFPNAQNNTPYYLEVKHRNSIETWSNSTVSFTGSNLVYNFTGSAVMAYGSNMIRIDTSPDKYAIYGGDVNQDGNIDAQDLSLMDNDAFNFVTGYVNTDITGDNTVDVVDLGIIDNNAFNFVSRITPP